MVSKPPRAHNGNRGSKYQELRTPIPKTILSTCFGIRVLKYWALGPSGICMIRLIGKGRGVGKPLATDSCKPKGHSQSSQNFVGMGYSRGPKDYINIRILQTMISGIPPILGLGTLCGLLGTYTLGLALLLRWSSERIFLGMASKPRRTLWPLSPWLAASTLPLTTKAIIIVGSCC